MVALSDILRAYNLPPTTIPLPEAPNAFQINIPITQNSQGLANANPVFTYKPATTYGMLLSAFALSSDATTGANYLFRQQIQAGSVQVMLGNNNAPATYQKLPQTYAYNPIPEGTQVWMPKGALLQLFGYYNGSSGQAGEVSVSILGELL